MERTWRHKTIENLEKKSFGDPGEASTGMVARCLQLCKVPLNQFTVEDLRLMIGQRFCLDYLVPLAIEHLKADPFVEGDYFPGDLLKSVLSIDPVFWLSNGDQRKQIYELIKDIRSELVLLEIPTLFLDGNRNEEVNR